MVIVSDYCAVESTTVSVVMKPPEPSFWWLSLVVQGSAQQVKFESQDARDTFYKTLVEAMGKP